MYRVSPAAEQLHEDLVRKIRATGGARREPVHRALLAVPRHLFVPEAPLADAYALGSAVVTRRGPDGRPLSSASSPSVVAMMLDQLDVRPGHRVLEIGAGTGYNAALLAELAGPEGHVVTVDVDPGCAARARAALDRTGHREVEVRTGDGTLGTGDGRVFDRIVVTAGAWDVPPAWFDQLGLGGRLVVPLRWRRQSRCVALVREPGLLRSDGHGPCGFMPLATPDGERGHGIGSLASGEPVVLGWDDDQPVDPDALTGVLQRPACTVWSGVTVRPVDPLHGLWVRLSTEPGACRIATGGVPRIPDGDVAVPVRGPAVVDGGSLAFLTHRGPADPDGARSELGAVGLGPSGPALARLVTRHVRAWDAARDALPQLTVHPAGTPDQDLPPGAVVEKHHARLVVAYPSTEYADS